MKKLWIGAVLFSILFLAGYWVANPGASVRAGSSSQASTSDLQIPQDLNLAAHEFLDYVSKPNGLTYENCPSTLGDVFSRLYQFRPESFDLAKTQQNFKETIKVLFLARAALRDRLKEFSIRAVNAQLNHEKNVEPEDLCISRTRDIFRLSRFLEDYLGEMFLGVKPFEKGKDPDAFGTFRGEEPWLLTTQSPSEVRLRSGDVIISRGNAYTSAAIARITKIDSQFSHVAFIYIEGDDSGKTYSLDQALEMPNVYVLEAHIEVGSTIRPLKKYLADGNARNMLLRYQDAQVAHRAAESTYKFMRNYTAQAYRRRVLRLAPTEIFLSQDHPDFHVPYDFKMDMTNKNEVFCSEVAAIGFAAQGVRLPLYPSLLVKASENDLVKSLGITAQQTYAPGDTELDPRFEMIAEWRDYRKVRSLRVKDAVLVAMYDWMESKDYEFFRSPVVMAQATGFLLARWVDFPKISIHGKVIFDVSKELPKNMTPRMAATIETLNRTAEILEKYILSEEDKDRGLDGRLAYVLPQMLQKLEVFRVKDSAGYEAGEPSKFHELFRPYRLRKAQDSMNGQFVPESAPVSS